MSKANYNKLKKDMEKLQKEYVEAGEKIFHEESKKLFDKYPELESFSWHQYTCYFNDGDTCTFSAYTDYPRLTFTNGSYFEEYNDEDGELPACHKKASNDLRELLAVLDNNVYKHLFGDHVEVCVHRTEGVKTEDYSSHD